MEPPTGVGSDTTPHAAKSLTGMLGRTTPESYLHNPSPLESSEFPNTTPAPEPGSPGSYLNSEQMERPEGLDGKISGAGGSNAGTEYERPGGSNYYREPVGKVSNSDMPNRIQGSSSQVAGDSGLAGKTGEFRYEGSRSTGIGDPSLERPEWGSAGNAGAGHTLEGKASGVSLEVKKGSSFEGTLIKHLTQDSGMNKAEAGKMAHRMALQYAKEKGIPFEKLNLVHPNAHIQVEIGTDHKPHIVGFEDSRPGAKIMDGKWEEVKSGSGAHTKAEYLQGGKAIDSVEHHRIAEDSAMNKMEEPYPKANHYGQNSREIIDGHNKMAAADSYEDSHNNREHTPSPETAKTIRNMPKYIRPHAHYFSDLPKLHGVEYGDAYKRAFSHIARATFPDVDNMEHLKHFQADEYMGSPKQHPRAEELVKFVRKIDPRAAMPRPGQNMHSFANKIIGTTLKAGGVKWPA